MEQQLEDKTVQIQKSIERIESKIDELKESTGNLNLEESAESKKTCITEIFFCVQCILCCKCPKKENVENNEVVQLTEDFIVVLKEEIGKLQDVSVTDAGVAPEESGNIAGSSSNIHPEEIKEESDSKEISLVQNEKEISEEEKEENHLEEEIRKLQDVSITDAGAAPEEYDNNIAGSSSNIHPEEIKGESDSKEISLVQNEKEISEEEKEENHLEVKPLKIDTEIKNSPKAIIHLPTTFKEPIPEVLDTGSTFKTYKKRTGVNDFGKEYEYMMCAFYAIKFSTDENISDFEMTTNDNQSGDFDDIALTLIWKNQKTRKFLLQLKHSEGKENSFVTDTNFVSESSDIRLVKYFDSFKTLKEMEDTTALVLYTNRKTKMEDGFKFSGLMTDIKKNKKTKVETNKYQAKFIVKKYASESDISLDSLATPQNTEEINIFQFEPIQNANLEYLRQFCHQFYFFAHQYNINNVRSAVRQMLETLLQQDIYDSFVSFIRNWWLGSFVLTKHDTLAKLTELALTPWIRTLSNHKTNSKTEHFKEAVMKFEMTIIQNCENSDIEDIWSTKLPKNKNVVIKKYGIDGQNEKILWYLGMAPLVVKVEDTNMVPIAFALHLLEKKLGNKKIVLVGNVDREIFLKWKIFENLFDILASSSELYNRIVSSFYISLQGRRPIPLQQLVGFDPEMAQIIGSGQILEMSQNEEMKIGDKEKLEDHLAEAYIPRSVSVYFIDTKDIIQHCVRSQKCILIINCDEKFENDFNFGFVEVAKLQDLLNEDNYDISNNLILLSSNQKCTFAQFEKISQLFPNFNIYVIKTFNDTYSTLEIHKGNELPLSTNNFKTKEKITCEPVSVPEEDIFKYFDDYINIFCAPPGMGKSTLLQILSSTYCPSDFCSIHVSLINQNSFLKTHPNNETILQTFLKLDDSFLSKIKTTNLLSKNKKIHLFLDGLDEIDREAVDLILNFVKDISSRGIHVWISSRENLQETISESLCKQPIGIEELKEEQGRKYIRKRLINHYTDEKIEKITNRIFKSADVTNSQQLLGVPLQLFIITELFIDNKNAYQDFIKKNIFILTKMYRLFFEGKKKFQFKKIGIDQNENNLGIGDFNIILSQYEIPALKACLDSSEFEKLGVNLNDNKIFLENISKHGDKFGIIKKINYDQIIFNHQTYAEYFACVWLKKHLDKVSLIQTELFSHRYQNLKLIFDIMMAEKNPLHLAVLYKNFDQFDKHFSNINSKDEGGRNALHLACSSGVKCQILNSSFYYIRLNRENDDYIKIFDVLMKKFHTVYDRDSLFNFSSLDYALESQCLYPIEEMLKNKKVSFDTFDNKLYDKFGAKYIAYYSAQLGYPRLLSNTLRRYRSFVNDFTFGDFGLLGVAIEGSKNDDYTSPRKGNINVVDLLIKYGADVNLTNDKNTILDYACDIGCYDMLQILDDNAGKLTDNNNILHRMALQGSLNEQVLINLKHLTYINAQNSDGVTPIHITCKLSQLENTKMLLKKNADGSILDKGGSNALHYAAESKFDNTEIINLLIQFGVDFNAQNNSGKTPLHIACTTGRVENVAKFLEKIDNFDIFDNEMKNVLHCAAHAVIPNGETIELLIKKGIDKNVRNKYGKTPLHFACTLGIFDNVKKLVELGVDVDICDNENQNALHYAAQSGYENTKTINFLINKCGLNINSQNKEGQTPLHIACKKGVFENIKKLLDEDADVDMLDYAHNNSLYYALNSGFRNEKIIKLLVEHRK